MTTPKKTHVVLTGRFQNAIMDFEGRLRTFDRQAMRGEDNEGRIVQFVLSDSPYKLYGLPVTSYEVHRSAGHGPSLEECVEICKRRIALNFNPPKVAK